MKNVITLSESDFRSMLQEALTAASNELDGKTESQTPKTTLDAKNNIQSFLSPYKSSRFIFLPFVKKAMWFIYYSRSTTLENF